MSNGVQGNICAFFVNCCNLTDALIKTIQIAYLFFVTQHAKYRRTNTRTVKFSESGELRFICLQNFDVNVERAQR